MTTFLLLLIYVALLVVSYVLGRIDGYWKRAEEDRRK